MNTQDEVVASRIQCAGVPSDKIGVVWSRAEELLQKGLGQGVNEIGTDDILAALVERNMQLWCGFDTDTEELVVVMVTEIIQHPKIKVCHIVANGGSRLSEWEPFMETIKAWALSLGCQRITAFARDGWIRRLKDYGYEKVSNVISCELSAPEGSE